MNKKRIILLILVFIAIWYFGFRGRKAVQAPTITSGSGTVTVQDKEHNASAPSSVSPALKEGTARVHFFTKDAVANCSTATVAVELPIDSKYGHPAAGALVAMTLPLSGQQATQYVSTLPTGTRLLTMQIDKDGLAHANYNSMLGANSTDCVKAERRAQITDTLKEFPEIKNVVITVDGQEWK